MVYFCNFIASYRDNLKLSTLISMKINRVVYDV